MSLTRATPKMPATSVMCVPNSYIPSRGWANYRGPRPMRFMDGERVKVEGLPLS